MPCYLLWWLFWPTKLKFPQWRCLMSLLKLLLESLFITLNCLGWFCFFLRMLVHIFITRFRSFEMFLKSRSVSVEESDADPPNSNTFYLYRLNSCRACFLNRMYSSKRIDYWVQINLFISRASSTLFYPSLYKMRNFYLFRERHRKKQLKKLMKKAWVPDNSNLRYFCRFCFTKISSTSSLLRMYDFLECRLFSRSS